MSLQRRISRSFTVPAPTPGFIGPGHLAAHVIASEDFALNDPFIMLADDHIDIGDRPVGGAHPHAGFETVTLLLEGAVRDRYEGGVIKAGEVQWMTAGRGVVHSESVEALGQVRLLQLWLTSPKSQRWTEPEFQDIHLDSIPIRRQAGAEVRLYSGNSGAERSKTRNFVPVTVAEMKLQADASLVQDLPTSYNGFLYILDGSVRVGEDGTLLKSSQVGWLDRPKGEGGSVLRIVAGQYGARLVLYAGQPQGDPIVSGGPFIGDSEEDIARLFKEYRGGSFERMSEIARRAREPQHVRVDLNPIHPRPRRS